MQGAQPVQDYVSLERWGWLQDVHQMGHIRLRKIDPAQLRLDKPLGSGQFGTVYLAHWLGVRVAAKELKLQSTSEKEFVREVKQLIKLNHPRVICFYGISLNNKKTFIVTEYCPGGTLSTLLQDSGRPLSWNAKITLARDVALGLNYLHNHGILHLDLAADNILLDGQERPKLADFGLSAQWVNDRPDMEGHSQHFRWRWNAPELLMQNVVGWETDAYCLGVVLWEIASRLNPSVVMQDFGALLRASQAQKRELINPLPNDTPGQYVQLVKQLWSVTPSARPKAGEVFLQLSQATACDFAPPRHLDQLMNLLKTFNLALARAWKERFHGNLPYIPAQVLGGRGMTAEVAVEQFLGQSKQVLLIQGDSGSGKTTLLARVAESLWSHGRVAILVSLPAIAIPEQNLMETILAQQGLNSAEVKHFNDAKIPIVLLLDGYDELQTDENLFISNQLEQWNLKVIISCRSPRLAHMQGDYRSRFIPTSGVGGLDQLRLQPFSDKEIKAYVRSYVKSQAASLPPRWQHVDTIWQALNSLRGMDSLLVNPLSLFLIISALPSLSLQERPTRLQLYKAFLNSWYKRQSQRLIQTGEIDPQTNLDFHSFAQNFAITLYKQSTQVARYTVKETLLGDTFTETEEASIWGPYFDHRYHPQVPILLSALPLQVSGFEWSFLHKSLWEYYVARAILSELMESKYQLLNLRLLNNESGILDLLSEVVRKKKGLKKALFAQVLASRNDPSRAVAAANSITILNGAQISFFNVDLSGVRIPGAILNNALMDSVNLRGSDLRNVSFEDAWLAHANLSEAKLDGASFTRKLSLGSDVIKLSFSSDGTLVAAAGQKSVALWDVAKGELLHVYNYHLPKVKRLGQKGTIQQPTNIAFSLGSHLLTVTSNTGWCQTWDLRSHQLLQQSQYTNEGIVSQQVRDTGRIYLHKAQYKCEDALEGAIEGTSTSLGKLWRSSLPYTIWHEWLSPDLLDSPDSLSEREWESFEDENIRLFSKPRLIRTSPWERRQQKLKKREEQLEGFDHQHPWHSLLSADAQFLACQPICCLAQTIHVWNVQKNTSVARIDAASLQAFSSNGRLLVVKREIDSEVIQWSNNQRVQMLNGNWGKWDFSSDNLHLAGSCDHQIQIWNFKTGLLDHLLEVDINIDELRYSGDGGQVMALTSRALHVWNANSGNKTNKWQLNYPLRHLYPSFTGQHFVTQCGASYRLFNLAELRPSIRIEQGYFPPALRAIANHNPTWSIEVTNGWVARYYAKFKGKKVFIVDNSDLKEKMPEQLFQMLDIRNNEDLLYFNYKKTDMEYYKPVSSPDTGQIHYGLKYRIGLPTLNVREINLHNVVGLTDSQAKLLDHLRSGT